MNNIDEFELDEENELDELDEQFLKWVDTVGLILLWDNSLK